MANDLPAELTCSVHGHEEVCQTRSAGEKGWIVNIAAFKDYSTLVFMSPDWPEGENRLKIHNLGELDDDAVRAKLKRALAMKGWGKISG